MWAGRGCSGRPLTWKPRSAWWRGASKRASSCAAWVRSGQSTRGALRRAASPPPPRSAAERKRGSRLIYRKGKAADVLLALASEVGAKSVYWNRQYEANIVARDTAIKSKLREDSIAAESFNGSLLFEPWEVTSKSTGGPFKVFTPFWRACCALGLKRGLSGAPEKISADNHTMCARERVRAPWTAPVRVSTGAERTVVRLALLGTRVTGWWPRTGEHVNR